MLRDTMPTAGMICSFSVRLNRSATQGFHLGLGDEGVRDGWMPQNFDLVW